MVIWVLLVMGRGRGWKLGCRWYGIRWYRLLVASVARMGEENGAGNGPILGRRRRADEELVSVRLGKLGVS